MATKTAAAKKAAPRKTAAKKAAPRAKTTRTRPSAPRRTVPPEIDIDEYEEEIAEADAELVDDAGDVDEYDEEAGYDEEADDYDDADADEYAEPVTEIPRARPARRAGGPGNRAQRRTAQRNRARARRAELAPAEREANGITLIAVDYDDETYWVPTDPVDWNVAATRAFEDGKAITALENLLEADEEGRSGYELLMSKRYRMKQINELFELIAQAGGFESAGN